jgi:cytochrome c-type biogenesis protein CcmH/NrfG
MTETLARVYLEQKNYDKAIQAYTILSLKYPEKNSFFAGQIRAIKKRQKDK